MSMAYQVFVRCTIPVARDMRILSNSVDVPPLFEKDVHVFEKRFS